MLPMIAKTATDIIKYANEFDSSYEFLVKYAKDIENPESKQTLIDELELLLSTIQNKDANAETVISDLTSFQKDLDTDYQNFQSDVNKAAEKIKGENGEIIALSGQIDAIHSAMYEGKWEMAGGGLMDIGGVIIIAVGPLCEIASGGSSTALIGGGVLVASGDVVMTTKASLDYRDKIDELETKTEQLKGDQTELAGLKATMAQVKGFVKGLETAITAVTSLQAEWQALDAHAQELMTAIEDAHPGTISPWLVIKLKRAKKDWKVALDQANKLQPDGKVQTKLYENLKDAFREATCIQENPWTEDIYVPFISKFKKYILRTF